MPIINTDLLYKTSANSAGGVDSLGGAITGTTVSSTVNQFWDIVSGAESSAGDTEYRCFYVLNNHGSLTLYNAYIWISSNTPSADTTIDIGLGTSAINGTEQTVANENTAPAGVSFSAPASFGAGLLIGDIPAGQHKAIWVRRTVNVGAAAYSNDTVTINVQGDTAS